MLHLVSLAVFFICSLMAMASLLPLTTGAGATTAPMAVNHTDTLAAGTKLLDGIAMRRLTETLGMPGNASVLTREGSELQVALTTMCSLRESIEAMWDLTVGEEDASLTLLRSMVQLLLQPTCKWATILLSEMKVHHTLTCVQNEIDRVCRDYQTLSFSKELQASISGHSNAGRLSQSQWIQTNIKEDEVLPEVYQEILK